MTRAAGIVLAAGESHRFGGPKLIAPLNGRPLLQHVLDIDAAAHLEPVIVVLGPDAPPTDAGVVWRGEVKVINPEPGRGLASSLRLGFVALERSTSSPEAALVLLGDQPRLQAAQVARILDAPLDPHRPIVVPRYENGRPGNPVRIERQAWSLAHDLTGDRGLGQIFDRSPRLIRYVDVPGINPDVDTPADLARITRDAARDLSGRKVAAGRSTPSVARRRRP